MHFAGIAVVLLGCRLETSHDVGATVTCQGAAEAARDVAVERGAALPEVGPLCDSCCPTQGLENVDPGGCDCGRPGIGQRLFGSHR